MGDLCSENGYECLCPADSLRSLTLADALEAVVSIKPQLEGSIEMLSEKGWIAFTSSLELLEHGSKPYRSLFFL